MRSTIIRWLILTLAVWVATAIVPGIHTAEWQSLLIAALVLGVLNTFVKPLLMLISVPFIIVTFGFFVIIINALLLKMTAWIVPGFYVASFWSALGGSLLISIVSLFFGGNRRDFAGQSRSNPPYSDPHRRPPPGKGPIIDI